MHFRFNSSCNQLFFHHLISPSKKLQDGLLPLLSDHHLLSSLLKLRPARSTVVQVHSKLVTANPVHGHAPGFQIWNSLLMHYSHGLYPKEAIYLYKQVKEIFRTNSHSFSFLLKACANCSLVKTGIQLHAIVVKKGFEFQVFVHTGIVNMYVACGALKDADKAFDEMPERNSVTWNTIITGLARWGDLKTATWHFHMMPRRDIISWTGLIDGFTRANRLKEAVNLFHNMMFEGFKPSEITVLAIFPSIIDLGELFIGSTLHAYCEKQGFCKTNIHINNLLIDMYAKCGCIQNSVKMFNNMVGKRDLVSWTSIVSGFALHGMAEEAVGFFIKMKKDGFAPNRITFLSVLNACSHGGLVKEGLIFFKSMVCEHKIEPEMKHYGCIIDMLGRNGRLKEAEKLIEDLGININAIVWRTLLSSCCKYGEIEMGKRIMEKIVEIEREYGGDYVALHNILASAGRFNDAQKIRRLMDQMNAHKKPGLASIGGNS